MGPGTRPGQVQTATGNSLRGQGPFQSLHVTLDPAAEATGGAQQEHTAGHARLPAPLRAVNVRFWVTMWPRSVPVSAASAIR